MIVRLCEWNGQKEDCELYIGKEVTLDHVPEQGDLIVPVSNNVYRVDFKVHSENNHVPLRIAVTKLDMDD